MQIIFQRKYKQRTIALLSFCYTLLFLISLIYFTWATGNAKAEDAELCMDVVLRSWLTWCHWLNLHFFPRPMHIFKYHSSASKCCLSTHGFQKASVQNSTGKKKRFKKNIYIHSLCFPVISKSTIMASFQFWLTLGCGIQKQHVVPHSFFSDKETAYNKMLHLCYQFL